MKIVDMKPIMSVFFFLMHGLNRKQQAHWNNGDAKHKEYEFDWRSNVKLKERLKTKSTK